MPCQKSPVVVALLSIYKEDVYYNYSFNLVSHIYKVCNSPAVSALPNADSLLSSPVTFLVPSNSVFLLQITCPPLWFLFYHCQLSALRTFILTDFFWPIIHSRSLGFCSTLVLLLSTTPDSSAHSYSLQVIQVLPVLQTPMSSLHAQTSIFFLLMIQESLFVFPL